MSPVSVPESRLGLTYPRRAVSLSPGWLLDIHTHRCGQGLLPALSLSHLGGPAKNPLRETPDGKLSALKPVLSIRCGAEPSSGSRHGAAGR